MMVVIWFSLWTVHSDVLESATTPLLRGFNLVGLAGSKKKMKYLFLS